MGWSACPGVLACCRKGCKVPWRGQHRLCVSSLAACGPDQQVCCELPFEMTAGGFNTSCLSLTSVGYKVPVCRNVTQALLTHMLLRLRAKQMAVLLQVGAGWYVMYVRMHRQGKGRRVGDREDGGGEGRR